MGGFICKDPTGPFSKGDLITSSSELVGGDLEGSSTISSHSELTVV